MIRGSSAFNLGLFAFSLSLSVIGCGQQLEIDPTKINSNQNNNDDNPPPPPPPPPNQTASQFSLSGGPANLSSELGQTQSFQITVTSQNNYAGPVNLSIDRGTLDSAFSANGDIVINITPASVNLTAGGAANATVSVEAKTKSPSFAMTDNGYFKVVGQANVSGSSVIADLTKPLAVSNIFTIRADSGLVFKAMQSGQTFTPGMATGLEFRSHTRNGATGLMLRYVNMDTAARTIHGQNGIPHQSGSMSPNGGTYETVVLNTVSPTATPGFYFHNDEAGGAVRTIKVNQP